MAAPNTAATDAPSSPLASSSATSEAGSEADDVFEDLDQQPATPGVDEDAPEPPLQGGNEDHDAPPPPPAQAAVEPDDELDKDAVKPEGTEGVQKDTSDTPQPQARPFSLLSQPDTPTLTSTSLLATTSSDDDAHDEPAQARDSVISASGEGWGETVPLDNAVGTTADDEDEDGPATSAAAAAAAGDSSTSSSPDNSPLISGSSARVGTSSTTSFAPSLGVSTGTEMQKAASAPLPSPSATSSTTTKQAEVEGQSALLERLNSQNSLLERDPAARRSSLLPAGGIRASFIRVQERIAEEATAKQGANEGEKVDWDFWGDVIRDYELVASTQPRQLSRAIQRGIPPALRGMTWQLMSASRDPGLEALYSQLLAQTSEHEKSIVRDLNRTFPGERYFQEKEGRECLFNVVKAYAVYDEEVGYTQGLQFIVGPLLLNMPDEEAFCVLVRLMKSYDLRSHYTPNMPGLQLRLFQFDRLVEELLPGVFGHLLRQGVKSSMYASQWFLTLFGYRFPLELVCAVFDLVFAEGVEAIFRFSLAILKRNEAAICKLEFEDCLEFLKNGIFKCYAPEGAEGDEGRGLYNSREFVREALQVRITPVMLDQFGEEWDTLCRQQNAQTLEIETLRAANRQLSGQVRRLEASLATLNEEHCELVRQVVQNRLDREELEDELVKVKIAFADLAHQRDSDQATSWRLQKQESQRRLNNGLTSPELPPVPLR